MAVKGFLYSSIQTGISTSADSGAIDTVRADLIGIDVNVTAVAGTVQIVYERMDAFGAYFPIWTSSNISTPSKTSITIGAGTETNRTIGTTGRVRWTVSGGATTFTVSVVGQ